MTMSTETVVETALLQPTSRTAAVRALRADGKHIHDLDLSKLDSDSRIALRKEWREIRKAQLARLDKAGQDAYRALEKSRNTARKAARQANRKAGPATIKVERTWLQGMADTIDRVAAAILDGKPKLNMVTSEGKQSLPPAQYLPRIATALRKQMEKPGKAGGVWLIAKLDKATGGMAAYDDRYPTEKRAAARAKKLAEFLEITGLSAAHGFLVMTLEDARKNGVTDIKEDRQPEADEPAAQAA